MDTLTAAAGESTQQLLALVADLLRPWAGDSSWGLTIFLVVVAWQIPLARWVLRSARVRIVRAVVMRHVSEDGGTRGADTRRENRELLRRELEARDLGKPIDVAIGRLTGLISLFVAVVVVVWSRTGESASRVGFMGLDNLADSPVRSGIGGILWALALAAAGTAAQVLVQRAAEVTEERQKFFATRMLPVFFFGLGLFLPGATVIAFTCAMTVSAIAVVVVSLDHDPANLRSDLVAP